jgi:hypothetical protein
LLRYLQLREDHLNEEVWRAETLEKLAYLKGQRAALVMLKRAPEEISQAREALTQQAEETN